MEANSCGALEKHMCEDERRGSYTQLKELGKNNLNNGLIVFNTKLKKH